MSGNWRGWELSGLLGLSVTDLSIIDRSVPDNSEESRRYWGVELRYHRWPDHEPFAYFFRQDDQDAGSERLGQTFGYDSSYVGVGARGRLFHRDLQYSCEAVLETGDSYASGMVGQREEIDAWAFDSEIRYVIPDEHRSEVLVEYMLTSGDGDRQFSPTNTVGGNQAGTKDESFVGWGYRNTGLVLAPRLSNLEWCGWVVDFSGGGR